MNKNLNKNPNKFNQSIITLNLKKDGKDLLAAGGNKLKWNPKYLDITLTAGDYDPKSGTVKVTVKNTGTDAVDTSDNLELTYILDNGAEANFTSEAPASQGKKTINTLDHTSGEWTENIKIDLKAAASSNLTLQLKLDGNNLGASVTKECKEEVQLSTTFVNKDFTGTADRDVDFTVENNGKNNAAIGNLKVRLISQKGKNYTINNENPDEKRDIDANSDLKANEDKSILTLTLDPKDDDEVEIHLQLVYRGQVISGTERKIIWNKEQKPGRLASIWDTVISLPYSLLKSIQPQSL